MTLDTTGRPVGAGSAPVTRERLFEAAIEVITERGYDRATMEDIATKAGVARRTAFNHFPAKSDIAVEWAVRRAHDAFGLARHKRTGTDRVRAYFHELAAMNERNWEQTRQLTRGLLRSYGSPSHRPHMPQELRDWLEETAHAWPGSSLPEGMTYPTLLTEMLYDIYQGALLRRIGDDLKPGSFIREVDAGVSLVLARSLGSSTQ
ncbi:TetR/AcrR family transcriptional regulator [Actinoplanes sp. TBRC 11911]|uniref:TetR/AcrR family transcriptional regulator n=1 Tax=Actinoplanes sp. TBRC 11911 TaxID=2729386 RepID=UPI00145C402C|nr:TetR/AcrR family transcriptional regulator [Actinoplanes sp. TBRC 11911]NMO55393.1 TetR/AcrR family transcriptional regulator [Actinoplanes sp. TBRC 11911]